MFIVYFDETGDDGYPGSSPLFVLSSIYLHYQNWKEVFNELYNFRKYLKSQYKIPIGTEFHTRPFLLNKNPFKKFNFSNNVRLKIIKEYASVIASLNIKAINVVICKNKINKPGYQILENAFKYSIQRLENTLIRTDPTTKFIIITDEGRVGKCKRHPEKFNKLIIFHPCMELALIEKK